MLRFQRASSLLARVTAVRHHGSGCCGHGHSHGSTDFSEVKSDVDRVACKRVTLIGAASNVALAGLKIGAGSQGGSVSLVADGMHSLIDVFSDAIAYASLHVTEMQTRARGKNEKSFFPRCQFPFGVGRVETTGAVMVALILLVGGVGLTMDALRRAYNGLSAMYGNAASPSSCDDGHHHSHDHGHSHGSHGHSHFEIMRTNEETGMPMIMYEMLALSVASLFLKEYLFRITKRVGERAGSRVVVANAYHHRADAWGSAVALVGVVGVSILNVPWLDGVAGFIVAGSVTQIGWKLLKGSVLEFFDYQHSQDVTRLRGAVHPVLFQEHHLPKAQWSNDLTLFNVFASRHGSRYMLHATVVAKSDAKAESVHNALADLKLHASEVLPHIAETYHQLIVIPSSANGDVAAFSKLLTTLLVEFHGIAQSAVEVRDITIDKSSAKGCSAKVEVFIAGRKIIPSRDRAEISASGCSDHHHLATVVDKNVAQHADCLEDVEHLASLMKIQLV